MGGSSGGTKTEVIQPTPAPQPSTADAIKEYVNSLPALYEAQLKYAPLEAQQQIDLANQYAVPYAQAYKQAQEVLYPGTSSLQESLAKQAQAGITGDVPDSLRSQYRSDLLAQLGENAKSGIGADYVSRNLINQQQQYQQYYQNLGLSLAGRQSLINAATPNYTNQLGSYQPGQGLSYTSNNYGIYSGANRPIVTQESQGTPNWLLGTQSVIGAVGEIGKGLAISCWVAKEIFGSWSHPKTIYTRYYIKNYAPKWFSYFYSNHGEKIAKFISNKILLKIMLRPLFELFAFIGKEKLNVAIV